MQLHAFVFSLCIGPLEKEVNFVEKWWLPQWSGHQKSISCNLIIVSFSQEFSKLRKRACKSMLKVWWVFAFIWAELSAGILVRLIRLLWCIWLGNLWWERWKGSWCQSRFKIQPLVWLEWIRLCWGQCLILLNPNLRHAEASLDCFRKAVKENKLYIILTLGQLNL